MPCDICGADGELVRAKIEDSSLRVCRNCARFGEVIPEPKVLTVPINRQGGIERRIKYMTKSTDMEKVLVSNYGNLVRQAREKKGLSQEELGKKVNERGSIIKQIEHGHIKPDRKVSKKLEDFLGIKLMDSIGDDTELEKGPVTEGLTLESIAKIRKIWVKR